MIYAPYIPLQIHSVLGPHSSRVIKKFNYRSKFAWFPVKINSTNKWHWLIKVYTRKSKLKVSQTSTKIRLRATGSIYLLPAEVSYEVLIDKNYYVNKAKNILTNIEYNRNQCTIYDV